MLRAALEVNPDSLILFFTRHVKRIEENVRAAEDTSLREPALRLWQLVQERSG
jgi:hypothetical protein